MPWKNGGGHTSEIAAHPPKAGMDAFAWRVSVAEIARDGPFSAFPGVDRTLVLLSGNGMRLAAGGETIELHARHEPVTFAGEAAIDCVLTGGPTRDFNLMVRRDRATGSVVVVREHAIALPQASALVCFAAEGHSECVFAGHPPVVLAQDHTLILLREEATVPLHLQVHPTSASSVALVAVVDVAADEHLQ